jgi:hypothetical protein
MKRDLEQVQGNMKRDLEQVQVNIERRLERIESNIGDLGAGIRSLNRQVSSMVSLGSNAFMFMHRGKTITDEEYYNVAAQFTHLISLSTEPFIDRLTHSANPLTRSEVARFKELVDKARRGEFFTREEVEEYSVLIERVQVEYPNDNDIWPLIALGAFLRGMYPGRQQD